MQLVEGFCELIFGIVALVDEEHARHARIDCGVVGKLGADLDAALTVDHDQGVARNAERLTDLTHEIGVAGGVDDIDLGILPLDVRERRGDRQAALLLFGVKVTNGVAVRDLAATVDLTREVKHCLSQ